MPEVNVAILLAHAPNTDKTGMAELARRIAGDVEPHLQAESGVAWRFHFEEPLQLESDDQRPAADFLSPASLRMAENAYDLVVVVTDTPLLTRDERVVSGLSSAITRIAALSTRRLRTPQRGVTLPLDDAAVRWNGGVLLLHLIGHCLGLKHKPGGGAMAPFRIEAERRSLPSFTDQARLHRLAARFPERERQARGWWDDLALHVLLAARRPLPILEALWRNRAPVLPLRMPGLATAAVAPTFLLVFTAEFWDAGLSMGNVTAAVYALLSILAATLYLAFVQKLFLPRKARHLVTEHLAVVDAVVLLTMLIAMIGLFFMVALLMLAIEIWVFPAGLISTWPTLQDPNVTLGDKFRLAAFISTIGVTTGALAGGLERRNVLRNLALFHNEV